MLDEYYVGEIDPLSTPVKKTTTLKPELSVNRNTATSKVPPKADKQKNNYYIRLLLVLVVLGMAIALGLYSSN